jgi:anti-anti-sigma factor
MWLALIERSPECVVLDLSRLSFIDSTGVHAVTELHKRAEQQRARVVIVPGPRAVQRIFELVGLTEVLPFLPGQHRIFGDPAETRSGAGDDA